MNNYVSKLKINNEDVYIKDAEARKLLIDLTNNFNLEKEISVKGFNTVNEMISNANTENICYVSGYYDSNDGGEGFWVIYDNIELGFGVVKLNNGKYAKIVSGSEINPLMFGIKENEDIGELLSNFNKNVTVNLLGKQYTLNRKIELESDFTVCNGSINCLITESCHDTFFSTEEGLNIKNTTFINVDVIGTPDDGAKIEWRPYLLYLKGENNLIENCNVKVLNNVAVGGTALWVRHGNTELINSSFIAGSEGNEGGALWCRAYDENDSLYVHAVNCHFETVTKDEAIAVWGSGDMYVKFDNCTFKTSRSKYAYTFRTFVKPIHATFSNCLFVGSAITSVINSNDIETSGGSVYLTTHDCDFRYTLTENTPFMDLRGVSAKGHAYFKFFNTRISTNKHLICIGGEPYFEGCTLNLSSVTYDDSGSIANSGTFKRCSINAPQCNIGGDSITYIECTFVLANNAYCGIKTFISMVRCALTRRINLNGTGANAVVNLDGNTRAVSGYTTGEIRCNVPFGGGGNVINNMLPVGAATTWFTSGNYGNNNPGMPS